MNIRKNYELYEVNNKVVLRQLVAPEYEMKTVLVADGIVSSEEEVGGCSFLVLKKDGGNILCWDRKIGFDFSDPCSDYKIRGDAILLKQKEKWYYWTLENDVPLCVGKPIVAGFLELFITEENLYYFDKDVLVSKECKEVKILDENFIFRNNVFFHKQLFPDVLKGITETGEFFVSIKKTTGRSYYFMGGETPGIISYEFIFSETSSEALIKWTTFVRNFLQHKLKVEGFCVPAMEFNESLETLSLQKYLKEDLEISLGVTLRQELTPDVDVIANVSRLYRGETKGSYKVKVRSSCVFYAVDNVDKVWIEKNDTENALFVCHDRQTDKIFCKVKRPFYLQVIKNVKERASN